MKVTESYWKVRWQFAWYSEPVLIVFSFLTYLQTVMQIFIQPNERTWEMLRIHHLNLFHIRRSLHLIFR